MSGQIQYTKEFRATPIRNGKDKGKYRAECYDYHGWFYFGTYSKQDVDYIARSNFGASIETTPDAPKWARQGHYSDTHRQVSL